MAGSDAGGYSVRQLGRVQISTTDQIDARSFSILDLK